jgi:DNA-binding cell septation regulator SpoVG
MNELVVTEVQIIPVKPRNGLVAFVSFIINGQFYIGNAAIYTSPSSQEGFRLVYPIKTLPTGKELNCVYPISREIGDIVLKAVVSKYKELLNKFA